MRSAHNGTLADLQVTAGVLRGDKGRFQLFGDVRSSGVLAYYRASIASHPSVRTFLRL
jgi:hypothetical protein